MHHTFLAVDLQLIGATGSTFLWPMLAISNICQGSACLAMMAIVANQKERGLAMASGVSAYLGITEPALFGVNLRFKFPFLIACASSGIAGMWLVCRGQGDEHRRRRDPGHLLHRRRVLGRVRAGHALGDRGAARRDLPVRQDAQARGDPGTGRELEMAVS